MPNGYMVPTETARKHLFHHLVSIWKPNRKPREMKHAYDIYSDRCPTRAVLDRIADKWALLILDRLGEGEARFNVLKREIEGISQKVLSQTLKNLERDGLISRKAFPDRAGDGGICADPLGQEAQGSRRGALPIGRRPTWTRPQGAGPLTTSAYR